MRFIVSTGNVYVHNERPEDARTALYKRRKNKQPLIVMPNEAYNRVGFYAGTDYTTLANQMATDIRARGDNPIYIKNRTDTKIIGQTSFLAAEASTPLRLAPPRWINCAKVKHQDKKFAFINIHPHASNVNEDGDWLQVDRAQKTKDFYQELAHLIASLHIKNFAVIVTGDSNIPEFSNANNHGGPADIANSHHMQIIQNGLEICMFSRNKVGVFDAGLTTEEMTGSDHPMYWYEFDTAL